MSTLFIKRKYNLYFLHFLLFERTIHAFNLITFISSCPIRKHLRHLTSGILSLKTECLYPKIPHVCNHHQRFLRIFSFLYGTQPNNRVGSSNLHSGRRSRKVRPNVGLCEMRVFRELRPTP